MTERKRLMRSGHYARGGLISKEEWQEIAEAERIESVEWMKRADFIGSVDYGNANSNDESVMTLVSLNPDHHVMSDFYQRKLKSKL